jgi:diguanylate cyclase (GGDEF)-like protein
MEKGKRVLVVDDDRENVELLSEYLTREGHSVTTAADGEQALHKVKAWKPHLILLDVNMPGITGLELIPRVRSLTNDDYTSIILVSANMTMEDVSKGLDAGADDYLTKPFRAQDLLPRVRCGIKLKDLHDNLRRANHRVEELSVSDDLTGLMNMRALYRKAEEEIARVRRFQKPVSGLVVNIDKFSELNSRLGFQFGNQVIRGVAGEIKKCVRSVDFVGRIGADEFFILLPETDLAGAEFVAERIRDAVEKSEIKADKSTAKVTVSVGIASLNHENPEGGMAELFRNATEALHSAKAAGNNKVEIYSFA